MWQLQAAFHDFVTNLHGIIHPQVLFPGSLSQTTFPYKHLAFICCPTGSSPFAVSAQSHSRHGAVMYHSRYLWGGPDTAQPRPWALPARAPATAEAEEANSAFTSKTTREIGLGSALEEAAFKGLKAEESSVLCFLAATK